MHFPENMSSENKLLLYSLYNEPGRYYHNLNHIKFMIAKLAQTDRDGGFRKEVWPHGARYLTIFEDILTAIWWHDSVYNFWMGAPYNERESARLFVDSNPPLPAESISNISNAIEATAFHLKDQYHLSLIGKFLLDIDLSAFAVPFAVVKKNTIDLFREAALSGKTWDDILKGQVKFLEALESKDKIFYTTHFFETHEAIARQNIEILLTNNYVEKLIQHAKQQ